MSEERVEKKRKSDHASSFSNERGGRRSMLQQDRRAEEQERRDREFAAVNVHERRSVNWKAPPACDPVNDKTQPINIGDMSIPCSHCGALFWANENMWCCNGGKVKFNREDLPPPMPDLLNHLLMTNSREGKHFRKHSRQFNAALAMTSMGTIKPKQKNVQENKKKIAGPCVYIVDGQLCHK